MTMFQTAGILLMVSPFVYLAEDRWIWSVPFGHRLAVFWLGFWISESCAALGALFSLAGGGFPRLVYFSYGCAQIYFFFHFYNIA